ncbi:MAG: hypothetical protein HZY76_20580 [Anaerolineae bacterium]|nr:MAG: hypothetical protein HZY76_20580 [Anaerolineae bacterium]
MLLTPLVVGLASAAWLWSKSWHWLLMAVTLAALIVAAFLGTTVAAGLITRGCGTEAIHDRARGRRSP